MRKEDFIWEMWNLTRELQRSRMGLCLEFCKKYNLTQQQVRILLQIHGLNQTTLTALAKDLDINPGNLSKTCKALEEGGFIKRSRDDEDKRVWTIELDEKGEKIAGVVVGHIQEIFASFSSNHTPKDLEEFLGFLREYVQFYRDILEKKDE